jgi:hypothetical protein
MRASLLIVLLLCLGGCSREDNFKPVYNVPAEFQPIIESFIHEASARGLSLEISNLIITYDENPESVYCGKCNSNALGTDVQKIISVNSTIQCWDNSIEQETLIFHELGHCILGRLHTSEQLPNGDPKSIMIQDNVTLYAPCIYQIGEDPCDNTFKRDYYLNELFDESTPVPDWAD